MEYLFKTTDQVIATPIQHKKASITFDPRKATLSRAPTINFSNDTLDY